MSDRPTVPVPSTSASWKVPVATARYWSRRTIPPMLGERWKAVSGPWGRFYAAIGVALVFVWQPRTLPALVALAVVVAVGSLGRRHWLWYAVPIGAVGVGTGRAEWMAAATGCIIAGHRLATRANLPDPLALRIHKAVAPFTKAPVTEKFPRFETFGEARDRIAAYPPIKGASGKASNPARRIRKVDERPINPVPRWLEIRYNAPTASYPIGGLRIKYQASCPDYDPDWRANVLLAAASKLPPMPDGTTPILYANPGAWHTDQDYVDATISKPLPRWVTLADLPHLPVNDRRDFTDHVVPLGLVAPDSPLGIHLEDDDTTAVGVWNPASDHVAKTYGVPIAPNFLLAGPPGSYKTSALRTIIHGCREHLGARLILIDGKREGAFAYLQDAVDVTETTDPAQAVAALADTHEEMLARYQTNDRRRRNGQPIARFQPIVVIIDEGMSLLDQLNDHPRRDDLEFWMVDISRLGRAGNVHLGWSTQRPDVQGVRGKGTIGQMRDSLELRLGGAGLSDAGAGMVYGIRNAHLGDTVPKKPRARLGMMVGSDFTLLQLGYTPDPLGHDPDTPSPYAKSARDLPNEPTETRQASDDTPPVVPIASRRRTMTP